MTASSASDPSRPTPHIDILFLGSPGIGKATFLSRLPSVQHPSVTRREAASQPSSLPSPSTNGTQISSSSTTTLPPPPDIDTQPPPYTSTTSLIRPTPSNSVSTSPPHPLSGPLTYAVSLFARPYTITIYPSTTALFTDAFPTQPPPRFTIIAFSIPDRVTLYNAKNYWLLHLREQYPDEEGMRVMLLGLKRDLRTDRRIERRNWGEGGNTDVSGANTTKRTSNMQKGARETANAPTSYETSYLDMDADQEYECVMPEEGLQAAQEMRVDRYAECSAMTGELMWEVVEDITRTAAKTTVEEGRGMSGSCCLM